MQTTKEEINYRLPEQCCGKCNNAYNSTYGDNCCKLLKSEDTIDFGGICDLYTTNTISCVDDDSVDEPDIIDTDDKSVEETRSCVTCIHSFYKENIPTCDIDLCRIENPDIFICNAWEDHAIVYRKK